METDTQMKIAAVFATMNRAATAVACVNALAAQSRPPDMVIVADNLSTDGTTTQLQSLSNLPFPLHVMVMPENRGNAGGVSSAMELAYCLCADAVWILDDDSWPRVDALRELLAGNWDHKIVRHSMQIDPNSSKYTWPLQIWNGMSFELAEGSEQLPKGDFIRTRIMWTGALVSKQVRNAVGPLNEKLFIRGEDEEYPWRFEKFGFQQEGAVKSILDHPGPRDLIQLNILGKRFFLERELADWKLYYKIRNMVWLKREQTGILHAIAMALTYITAVAWLEGIHRVPLALEAIKDGLLGRLGKWKNHP